PDTDLDDLRVVPRADSGHNVVQDHPDRGGDELSRPPPGLHAYLVGHQMASALSGSRYWTRTNVPVRRSITRNRPAVSMTSSSSWRETGRRFRRRLSSSRSSHLSQ